MTPDTLHFALVLGALVAELIGAYALARYLARREARQRRKARKMPVFSETELRQAFARMLIAHVQAGKDWPGSWDDAMKNDIYRAVLYADCARARARLRNAPARYDWPEQPVKRENRPPLRVVNPSHADIKMRQANDDTDKD